MSIIESGGDRSIGTNRFGYTGLMRLLLSVPWLLMAVACSAGTTDVGEGASTADVVPDVGGVFDIGTVEVVATDTPGSGEIVLLDGAASDVDAVDVGGVDSAEWDGVAPDGGSGDAETGAGDTEGGDTGSPVPTCCSPTEPCPLGEACYGLPNGQCLPTPENGHCFEESDCGPNQDCQGEVAGCGLVPELGSCVLDLGGCCTELWELEECDGGYCVAGFCVPLLAEAECLSDGDCGGLGITCQGSVAPALTCQAGGVIPAVAGVCAPVGPGGLCTPVLSDAFGECGDALGWGWTGHQCAPITGCVASPRAKN